VTCLIILKFTGLYKYYHSIKI